MKQKRNNLNKLQNENEVLNQLQNKQTKIDRLKGDMVSLINKLIDSIKEYNKVSQTNNINANQIFSYYEEEQQQIQNLFNDIINNGQYQRVSELYEENNILSKLIEQLKENSNSSLQNLQLFFVINFKNYLLNKFNKWGLGDWGLGIGDWGLGPIPNPQSPIPNPQKNNI